MEYVLQLASLFWVFLGSIWDTRPFYRGFFILFMGPYLKRLDRWYLEGSWHNSQNFCDKAEGNRCSKCCFLHVHKFDGNGFGTRFELIIQLLIKAWKRLLRYPLLSKHRRDTLGTRHVWRRLQLRRELTFRLCFWVNWRGFKFRLRLWLFGCFVNEDWVRWRITFWLFNLQGSRETGREGRSCFWVGFGRGTLCRSWLNRIYRMSDSKYCCRWNWK